MNHKTGIILFAIVFAIPFTWQSEADELKLAQGYLTAAGKVLPNHALLVEGTKVPPWYAIFALSKTGDKVKTLATTDDRGFFQVVDLPAGDYTLKLVRPGEEPVPLKTFTLPRNYKIADFSVAVKVIGVTTDGIPVFSTGIDANGRKVTRQATSTNAGLLADGTTWTLKPETKE